MFVFRLFLLFHPGFFCSFSFMVVHEEKPREKSSREGLPCVRECVRRESNRIEWNRRGEEGK